MLVCLWGFFYNPVFNIKCMQCILTLEQYLVTIFFFLISDKRHRDDEYVAILDLQKILKTFLDVCYCQQLLPYKKLRLFFKNILCQVTLINLNYIYSSVERKVKSIVMNTRVVTRTEIGRSGVIAVVGTTRTTKTAAGTRADQGRTPRATSVQQRPTNSGHPSDYHL